MPNTKSAIRRVRRVKKQTQVNRIRKSKYKNAIKQMDLLIKSKNKEKAKNIAQAGYEFVIENLTWEVLLPKYVRFYEDLVKS